MNIFEYDQEKHIRMEKKESYEEGVQDGERRGEQSLLTKQVSSKVKKGYTLEQTAEALEYPIKELEPIYNMVRETGGYNASSDDKEKMEN